MTHSENKVLADIEAQMERSDPQFSRGLDSGQPCSPREYRRGPGWLLLALSLVLVVAGFALPQGLLLATGLVLAGVAQEYLFDPARGHTWFRRLHTP
ncbi:DUF3040 domain-containing protein [Streptomyces nanhaiensis]|uniref:DUF3040 domain-containing protein n=1 Tax=Streptomyces nanhaiensis TaxID=679319 RepID=UPI00399CC899